MTVTFKRLALAPVALVHAFQLRGRDAVVVVEPRDVEYEVGGFHQQRIPVVAADREALDAEVVDRRLAPVEPDGAQLIVPFRSATAPGRATARPPSCTGRTAARAAWPAHSRTSAPAPRRTPSGRRAPARSAPESCRGVHGMFGAVDRARTGAAVPYARQAGHFSRRTSGADCAPLSAARRDAITATSNASAAAVRTDRAAANRVRIFGMGIFPIPESTPIIASARHMVRGEEFSCSLRGFRW